MSCNRCHNTGLVGMTFCHCPAGSRKSLDLAGKQKADAKQSTDVDANPSPMALALERHLRPKACHGRVTVEHVWEALRLAEAEVNSPAIQAKVTDEDVAWAKKHGWVWDADSKAFTPYPVIQVIPNPAPGDNAKNPGWCPWLQAIGAVQTDAPFHSVRAALRVAEEIRQHKRLGPNEMNCAEEA